jgi:hypothetical protein
MKSAAWTATYLHVVVLDDGICFVKLEKSALLMLFCCLDRIAALCFSSSGNLFYVCVGWNGFV